MPAEALTYFCVVDVVIVISQTGTYSIAMGLRSSYY